MLRHATATAPGARTAVSIETMCDASILLRGEIATDEGRPSRRKVLGRSGVPGCDSRLRGFTPDQRRGRDARAVIAGVPGHGACGRGEARPAGREESPSTRGEITRAATMVFDRDRAGSGRTGTPPPVAPSGRGEASEPIGDRSPRGTKGHVARTQARVLRRPGAAARSGCTPGSREARRVRPVRTGRAPIGPVRSASVGSGSRGIRAPRMGARA